MTEYTLIRSERKTAAICIKDGGVQVRAPLKMPLRDIDSFVKAKEKWIEGRLKKSREQAEERAAFALNYGSAVLYRGKEYPITAKNGDRIGFDGLKFYMPPGLPPAGIKAACVSIYRMLAQKYLTAVTMDMANRMGVTPTAIKVSGAAKRWGSCSARKNINFSWRLVMADDEVIAYVAVHELAHLREMNHSAKFWNIVAGVTPGCGECKERLKELQKRLAKEDWSL